MEPNNINSKTETMSPVFETSGMDETAALGAHSVFATDLDGDGDTDILSASWFDGKIAWYENTSPPPGIPTVSEWGMALLALLLLIAGSLLAARHKAPRSTPQP